MKRTEKVTTLALLAFAIGTRVLKGQTAPTQSGSVKGTSISADISDRFAILAPQIVRFSGLRPGTRVVIRGTASMLPLMDQLALETERAGAVTTLSVTTDRIQQARRTLPASQQLHTASLSIAERQANDITFTFPMFDNFTVDTTARPEQQRTDAAIDSMVRAARQARPWRDVLVMVPTPSDTVNTGVTFADLIKMRMDAMASDYTRIAQIGRAIRDRLRRAKQIRVTSPDGTDVTFTPVSSQVLLSAGLLTAAQATAFSRFPGGNVYAIIRSPSANGTIRAPWDWCFRPVENESIDIHDGRPTKISAGGDEECVRKSVEPLRLGVLSIGLNPASDIATTGVRAPANDFYGAGMVAFGLGPGERVAAGDVQAALQWIVPIPHATVLADGVALVRDGQLIVPTPPHASAATRP